MAMTSPSASSPLVAATCIISAMALIGLIDNLVILIAERAGLWQLHLLRSLMALPMILVISRAGGWLVSPKRLWAVALRSLLVSISMVFYFGSLAFLPVAQAAAGLFTAPIFVLLLSVVALRRRVGLVNAIAVGAGFLGILVVLRPDFGEFFVRDCHARGRGVSSTRWGLLQPAASAPEKELWRCCSRSSP